MTPGQYEEVTRAVDRLVDALSTQEACHKYEVLEAMMSYLDRDSVNRVYCEELGHMFNHSGRCIRCTERRTEGTTVEGEQS